MPRVRDEAGEDRDELELLLAELADAGPGDSPRDPDGALRLLARGGLTEGERDEIHRSAVEALYGLEQLERAESSGAVTTGPREALVSMRQRRVEQLETWRRVLAELEALA